VVDFLLKFPHLFGDMVENIKIVKSIEADGPKERKVAPCNKMG
jgi:hypothetical protein